MTTEEPSESVAIAPGPFRGLAVLALGIAAFALVALALVEAWQVFARYVLDAPAGWTEPVALVLLKTTLLFAAAVGVRHETHFRFALGMDALPLAWRRALQRFALLATGTLGAVFAYWGTSLVIATWAVKAPGAALSSGAFYLPFAIGGVLFVLFALERCFTLGTQENG